MVSKLFEVLWSYVVRHVCDPHEGYQLLHVQLWHDLQERCVHSSSVLHQHISDRHSFSRCQFILCRFIVFL